MIKCNIDIFFEFVFHNFSNFILDETLLSELKNTDMIPVF